MSFSKLLRIRGVDIRRLLKKSHTQYVLYGVNFFSLTVRVSPQAEVWILNLSEAKRFTEEARSITRGVGDDCIETSTAFVKCEYDSVDV